MQFLRNTWFKILLAAAFFLLLSILFPYLYDEKNSGNDKLKPDIVLKDSFAEQYDNFWVDKISIVKRIGDKRLFSISADKVIHRKRISKLFVYQNLKEIYMTGVKIDVYSYNKLSADRNVSLPVGDIGRSFTSLGKPPTPVEEYLEGNSDINLDMLSRLVLDNLIINIYLSPFRKISLNAKSASINPDLTNLILKENVLIYSSDGREFRTSQAIWNKKYNGVYFPEGYFSKDKKTEGKYFYNIAENGDFLKAPYVPDIEYIDFFEENEKALYTQLSKKMPVFLRFMTGMQEMAPKGQK
jgi:hypothetical protein